MAWWYLMRLSNHLKPILHLCDVWIIFKQLGYLQWCCRYTILELRSQHWLSHFFIFWQFYFLWHRFILIHELNPMHWSRPLLGHIYITFTLLSSDCYNINTPLSMISVPLLCNVVLWFQIFDHEGQQHNHHSLPLGSLQTLDSTQQMVEILQWNSQLSNCVLAVGLLQWQQQH